MSKVLYIKANIKNEGESRTFKVSDSFVENYKKELTWGNFITIILLLMQNEETKPLVEVMGLYPEDLKNFLMFQE